MNIKTAAAFDRMQITDIAERLTVFCLIVTVLFGTKLLTDHKLKYTTKMNDVGLSKDDAV